MFPSSLAAVKYSEQHNTLQNLVIQWSTHAVCHAAPQLTKSKACCIGRQVKTIKDAKGL